MSSGQLVTVVGGGLAGCEAALQFARFGIPCRLVEMRPESRTPVHATAYCAEIVCSNSLKSTALTTASGLLKAELELLGCRLLACARRTAVPAGSALAVDRWEFSQAVESLLESEPLVQVVRQEVRDLPQSPNHTWLVATGPLTSPGLQEELARHTGRPHLHFFDAIAPTVTLASLDQDQLYRAARYGKGGADYLNAPLDEAAYAALCADLIAAATTDVAAFDRHELFHGCQPIEEIARSGPQSLAFGPLRPVGLPDPRTGVPPYAVIQLRQENRQGTLFGLVGFQTRLKQAEQRRIFRRIPGLAAAEFVRYGQLHRNFFLDTPRCLQGDFSLPARPDIFLAGQMIGVEGYVESMASGLVTAWRLAARLLMQPWVPLPPDSILGSLLEGFLFDTTTAPLMPMNANFGLLPRLPQNQAGRNKRLRKVRYAERALASLRSWRDDRPPP